MSSDLRSITNRSDTSIWYYKVPGVAYRMSKAALNMLAVCNYAELKGKRKGVKVWAFNPGYVVTNLSGEKGVEERIREWGRGCEGKC